MLGALVVIADLVYKGFVRACNEFYIFPLRFQIGRNFYKLVHIFMINYSTLAAIPQFFSQISFIAVIFAINFSGIKLSTKSLNFIKTIINIFLPQSTVNIKNIALLFNDSKSGKVLATLCGVYMAVALLDLGRICSCLWILEYNIFGGNVPQLVVCRKKGAGH